MGLMQNTKATLLGKVTGEGGPMGGVGRKFRGDVLWNVASLAVLGVSGVAINILISIYYTPAVLGIFNQVFSVYMVASQFAVLGVHLSVQRAVAAHGGGGAQARAAALAACLDCLLTSAAFCLLLLPLTPWIGRVLRSGDVATGIYWVLPGIGFFAMNKVLLGILNGQRRLKAYAVTNGMRMVLAMLTVWVWALLERPGNQLPVAFSIGEGLLALALLGLTWQDMRPGSRSGVAAWMWRHLHFGWKGLLVGIAVELNSRVDVLLLGVFVSDSQVGIYSFAATLATGFNQLFVVLRTNLNPVLARMWHLGQSGELRAIFQRSRKAAYTLALPLGLLLLAGYPLATWLLPFLAPFQAGFPVLALLMGGTLLYAGYIPFSHIFLQIDSPGTQSLLTGGMVLLNIALNLVLVPLWGKEGAALATGLDLALFTLALDIIIRWVLRRHAAPAAAPPGHGEVS